MSAAATETALYVYGVVAAGDDVRVPPGLGIELVKAGSLAAVARGVSLAEFGEEALRTNLNDRAWLESIARAHEDVLLAVAAAVDVLPFRFGTICHNAEDVRALLEAQRDALAHGLERVKGRAEVGVKLWVDPRGLTDEPGDDVPAGGTGRAYLEARRGAQRRVEDARARCSEVARQAYERLLRHAVDGVVNRPQPRELTGSDEEMLLNAAFLVESGDPAIRSEVERLNEEHRDLGFRFEVTGPWPAHNFVYSSEEAQ